MCNVLTLGEETVVSVLPNAKVDYMCPDFWDKASY